MFRSFLVSQAKLCRPSSLSFGSVTQKFLSRHRSPSRSGHGRETTCPFALLVGEHGPSVVVVAVLDVVVSKRVKLGSIAVLLRQREQVRTRLVKVEYGACQPLFAHSAKCLSLYLWGPPELGAGDPCQLPRTLCLEWPSLCCFVSFRTPEKGRSPPPPPGFSTTGSRELTHALFAGS